MIIFRKHQIFAILGLDGNGDGNVQAERGQMQVVVSGRRAPNRKTRLDRGDQEFESNSGFLKYYFVIHF